MKTSRVTIISLAFAASVVSASDWYYFDVYNYDPDLDPDLQGGSNTSLATQPAIGDAYSGSNFDRSDIDGIIRSSGIRSENDIYGSFGNGNHDLE